jgi:iturin family lipopeptide synthetase A
MERATGLEIAIIGYSGRFTGCSNIREYWEALYNGKEMISFFNNDQLNEMGIPEGLLNNPGYVKANGELPDKDCFDAEFWGYTPDEAMVMDPQMRLFHECVWEALEMAGYSPAAIREKVGLYGSASNNPLWQSIMFLRGNGASGTTLTHHLADREFLCSRIAYKLNLKGPAVFVQTACSSSLVAVHQACRALLTGECDMALAGGVSASLLDKGGYLYAENMILSSDGHCRAFDARANGTVRGEGVGIVVLKKYAKALEAGDKIHAVIKGSAVNNDGNEKVGYTAPGIYGQTAVIKKALKIANVEPGDISYIETHGTGTRLGDPIEVEALKQAFEAAHQKSIPIGSVKTNIGHLDAAAGIASLIKVILMLKHKQIPQSLFFNEPNPKIDFVNSPFYVNNSLQEWKGQKGPRLAGVSSFGIGGTNAHLIISEHVDNTENPLPNDFELLTISARSENSLRRLCENLSADLVNDKELDLPSFAYTINTGRASFSYRKSFLITSKEEAIRLLADHDEQPVMQTAAKNFNDELVFVFSGQGSQYAEMAKGLYDKVPAFRDYLNECFHVISNRQQINMRGILYPAVGSNGESSAWTTNTLYAQLALFSVSYSLARLLMDWGIQPSACIGHSIGEYVCACVAGVLDLEDALHIVAERGRLMQATAPGEMYYVKLTATDLHEMLTPGISIAAINSIDNCVVSGAADQLQVFLKILQQKDIVHGKLKTAHAFHSQLMDPVIPSFVKFLENKTFRKPRIPYVSNVTGDFIEEGIDAAYFGTHLRATVKFKNGIQRLIASGKRKFIEIGPGGQLVGHIMHLAAGVPVITALGSIRQFKHTISDDQYLFKQLGEYWKAGAAIDWKKVYEKQYRRKLALSPYAFEKLRFPFRLDLSEMISDLQAKKQMYAGTGSGNPQITDWFYRPVWHLLQTNGISQSNGAAKPRFLVFSGKGRNAADIIDRLQKESEEVIVIEQGDAFIKKDDHSFCIDPGDQEHYEQLLKLLLREGNPSLHIIHTYYLDHIELNYPAVNDALSKGYLSLCNIAKAIGKANYTEPVSLFVLTNETAAVAGSDTVNPLKTAALGAVKVIPIEYLTIRCKMIDLPLIITENVHKQLKNELVPGKTEEVFVAIRNEGTYIHATERINDIQVAETLVEADGCYIVTGGFGGMGYTIGMDLAAKDKANVVLVIRSYFPERDDWDQWLLEKGAIDNISIKISELRNAEACGATIMIARADVADREAMKQLIEKATNRFGTVRGVIWAAGVIDYGGVIQKRSPEDYLSYVKAKIHGLLLMSGMLDFSKLDFLLLFSSMGNVLYQSKFGQVAYCVANEFLEAFSQFASRHFKTKVCTINWNDWKDVGMSVKALQKARNIRDVNKINELLADAVSPQEGLAIVRKCLNGNIRNLYLSKTDLKQAITKIREASKAERNLDFSKVVSRVKYKRPALSTDYETPATITGQLLEKAFCGLFGFEKVGVNDNFFELGGDSLKAMAILIKIEQDFRKKISLEIFFNNPSIAQLEKFIDGDQLQVTLDNNAVILTESESIIPLSPAQQRMYLLNAVDPDATNYNQIFCFKVPVMEMERLENACRSLIARHEILRSSFELADKEVRQCIKSEAGFLLQADEVSMAHIEEKLQESRVPFNLAEPPLFKVGLLKITDDPGYNIIWIDIHHIISDGLSSRILLQELFALYHQQELPPVEAHFREYIAYLKSPEVEHAVKAQKEYWIRKLSGTLPSLNLYTDNPRQVFRNYEGRHFLVEINAVNCKRVHELAAGKNASVYIFSVSIAYLLLWKLSGQDDILIGITTTGREQNRFLRTIGMFINTLVARITFDECRELTFTAFLDLVKREVLQSIDNQLYPFQDLINELDIPRARNRNPVFDVLVSSESTMYGNEFSDDLQQYKSDIQPFPIRRKVSNFDLRISLVNTANSMTYFFEYAEKLFTPETIGRYATYFENIFFAVLDNPVIKIKSISLSGSNEKPAAPQFADSRCDLNVIGAISANFSRYQTSAAVTVNGRAFTYGELGEQVNKLTSHLYTSGVKRNDVIALYMAPGLDMIVSILAVLKAGAAFLPVEPNTPVERLVHMIGETAPVLLLTTSDYFFDLSGLDCKIFATDIQLSDITTPVNHDIDYYGDDLAYMIYTSGSTGVPKAVQICNANLANYVSWFVKEFALTNNDSTPLLTSYAFDLGYSSVFPVLVAGGTLHVVDRSLYMSPKKLIDYLFEYRITYLKLTPSLFTLLVSNTDIIGNKFSHIKYIVLGGEKIRHADVKKCLALNEHIVFVDEYGPTETTVGVVYQRITRQNLDVLWDRCIIGRPISNTVAYVMDEQLHPCEVGVVGELCIAGHSVGPGYRNGGILNAAKFIENYWPDTVLYRTGDMARLLGDGTIEFLGRTDTQIKIRGFRIDQAEIINALLKHPKITEAFVAPVNKTSETELVAWFVASDKLSFEAVRSFLRNILPEYAVPSFIVQVEKFPLTLNNKIDVKKLPAPENDIKKVIVPPTNKLEEQLIGIWAGILQTDLSNIGINKGFFELGGSSLKAVLLAGEIEKVFGVELPVAAIFEHPTIAELAANCIANNGDPGTGDYVHSNKAIETLNIIRGIGAHS